MVVAFGAYIAEYGYMALFGLFFLGIIGMPLPEETLLVFSGFLVSTGQLKLFPTYLVCFLGSVLAMTTAYFIGRCFGYAFIDKYGKKLGLGYTVYKKTEEWFNKVGKWALPLGYFIPGVRQFSAYFAGMTRMPLFTFLWLTYSGGLFWSILFITLGWQLGERWELVFAAVSRNLAIFFLFVIIVLAGLSYWRWRSTTSKTKRGIKK
ncbi:DedA family protein [Brevibacillus fulvus]|uniref:Membrane protein DedA with SNARE-associated domain n=1 Tax=Brevibacillus fulvus TaxID=1125967 RepID=A0A938Y0C5_9BACL|nr:DedA family protein [Brevibacillus fulvus]MBM7590990.1 membrane protein DedA with SNARE-associated domain [Brevibacillus fulvus]